MGEEKYFKYFQAAHLVIASLRRVGNLLPTRLNIVGSDQKQTRQRAEDSIDNTARRSNEVWFGYEPTIYFQAA